LFGSGALQRGEPVLVRCEHAISGKQPWHGHQPAAAARILALRKPPRSKKPTSTNAFANYAGWWSGEQRTARARIEENKMKYGLLAGDCARIMVRQL